MVLQYTGHVCNNRWTVTERTHITWRRVWHSFSARQEYSKQCCPPEQNLLKDQLQAPLGSSCTDDDGWRMCQEVQSSDSVGSVSPFPHGDCLSVDSCSGAQGSPQTETIIGTNGALCNINGGPTVCPTAQSSYSHHQLLLWTESNIVLTRPKSEPGMIRKVQQIYFFSMSMLTLIIWSPILHWRIWMCLHWKYMEKCTCPSYSGPIHCLYTYLFNCTVKHWKDINSSSVIRSHGQQ